MGGIPRDYNPQPATTRAERVARISSLIEQARQEHFLSDEDCWYACPKSGNCCDPAKPKDQCNCGADAHNAWIDELKKEFSLLVDSL